MDSLDYYILTEIANHLEFKDFISLIGTNKKNNELKHYITKFIEFFEAEFNKQKEIDLLSSFIVSKGHLDSIKYLHFNNYEFDVKAMNLASYNGHLEVIKWLHENREEGCTKDAMDYASDNGHLEVAIWLHENRTDKRLAFILLCGKDVLKML